MSIMKNTHETTRGTWNPHLLDQFEQYEMLSKAALSLALNAPDDDASLEEKNAMYEQQKQRILNFVNLLHDSLVSEHGKVLLCLYQCHCGP